MKNIPGSFPSLKSVNGCQFSNPIPLLGHIALVKVDLNVDHYIFKQTELERELKLDEFFLKSELFIANAMFVCLSPRPFRQPRFKFIKNVFKAFLARF